jgi:hypothetical protein
MISGFQIDRTEHMPIVDYKTVAVYKITTFVPLEGLERLLDGITRVVPLNYGRLYDHVVWWSTVGIEQFRPLEGSNPISGREGELERDGSVRLEFSIPREPGLLERLLKSGLLCHHPWEKPVVYVDESLAVLTQPDKEADDEVSTQKKE